MMAVLTSTLGSIFLTAQSSFPAIPCGDAVPVGGEVTVCATVPNTGSDYPYAGGCTDSQGNDYMLQATVGDASSHRCTAVWTSVVTTALSSGDTIQPVMFWANIGQGAFVPCAGIAVRGG